MIKDCFYGAITQSYGLEGKEKEPLREILSQLFEAQGQLLKDAEYAPRHSGERQAANSKVHQTAPRKGAITFREHIQNIGADEERAWGYPMPDYWLDPKEKERLHEMLLASQEDSDYSEASEDVVQPVSKKTVHQPRTTKAAQNKRKVKTTKEKRKETATEDDLVEVRPPLKKARKGATEDAPSATCRRSHRTSGQQKPRYRE